MTDDQTLRSFGPGAMPYTWELFQEEGTLFTQAVATPPLCCPSRAGFLTGQYPHEHGVDANVPGYPALREKESVLPAWLDRAGYRTGFVGKYLNGYESVGGDMPAPGWDSWFAASGYPAYFDYAVSDQGRSRRYGSSREDYSTDVFAAEAMDFVSAGDGRRPFFLWLALNAPHVAAGRSAPCGFLQPEPPSPRAFSRYADEPLPRDPSFAEADVSDKPSFIRDGARLSAADIEEMTLRWRCGLATLRSADGAMEKLVAALEEAGELDETLLVFTSDNGYFFGEHNRDGDKRLPYGASLRVPLAVRMPASVAPAERVERSDALVANIDLAPTVLELAGARPCAARHCRSLDGRSLLPLLAGELEGWADDRAVLVELDDAFTYRALRTRRYLYSELAADRGGPLAEAEVELYDLRTDPHELHNLWREDRGAASAIQARLARRLDRLAED